VLSAARAAVGRDPADPLRWNELGAYELRWGTRAAARDAFVAANRANPWSLRALRSRAHLAAEDGETARRGRLCRRIHRVAPRSPCPGR
jgi:hypothetical protein